MSTTLAVPTMNPFTLPVGSTIELEKEGLPISSYCNTNLTTENFEVESQCYRNLKGGFLNMGKNFFSEAGALAVTQLAKETKRKFRLGTPLEALAYKKANLPHPTYFTVLSKVFSVHVLYWRDWGGDPGFNLDAWVSCWSSNCGVFVVEDLE